MSSGTRKFFSAVDVAGRAGKYAFGLDEAKAVSMLRKIADDVESGRVALHSVSTSTFATYDEFTVQELVVEVLEETPATGPQVVKS